jgi:hypothetical protein
MIWNRLGRDHLEVDCVPQSPIVQSESMRSVSKASLVGDARINATIQFDASCFRIRCSVKSMETMLILRSIEQQFASRPESNEILNPTDNREYLAWTADAREKWVC